MKGIGLRVAKTAAAVAAAIWTAQLLDLTEPLFAGVLAILGVETTRRKGFRSLFERLAAGMIALLVSSALFELIGYRIWTAAIYVLLVFPLLSRLRLRDGIVPGSVLVFHVYGAGEVTAGLLLNELLLLLVGLGWSALFNHVYMPGETKRLQKLRTSAERKFGEIFAEMAAVLRDPGRVWSGSQLLELEADVAEGEQRAQREQHNRPWEPDFYWTVYFAMRRLQLESLASMLQLLSYVYGRLPQGELLADLLEKIEGDISSDYYEDRTRLALAELRRHYRTMELPRTRDEFEARSALLQLCLELERFLDTASRHKKRRNAGDSPISGTSRE
ncbi:aromatic acid exporter family protein [Paenibacillus sp. D51F]